MVIKIKSIVAREILDSRGFPTVEADVIIEDPKRPGETLMGRAAVPSGASTGDGEALELRDGDAKRYLGKGVSHAVKNIQDKITPAVVGHEYARQSLLDDLLRELDGTPNKSKLGANAILAVSMAAARARALAEGVPLYQSIAKTFDSKGCRLPVPLMNVINGGSHADNSLEIQEFMIVPAGFKTFSAALQAGSEVFHHLKKLLNHKKLSTGVGDEGGFAPNFEGPHPHDEALNALIQAISNAGYKPGKDIFIALDVASSEWVDKNKPHTEKVKYRFEGEELEAADLISIYEKWIKSYPLISIEDGLSEHDWAGWALLTERLGKKVQLVGDDLFVTNPELLKKGIDSQTANTILIKLNQIGTVTETLETMKLAATSGYRAISSHRSGETEDTFIADLAVGTDCGQIKTGSLSRTDRIAKYNQLLRIEKELAGRAEYAGTQLYKGIL